LAAGVEVLDEDDVDVDFDESGALGLVDGEPGDSPVVAAGVSDAELDFRLSFR
jgi:hypothetical protein